MQQLSAEHGSAPTSMREYEIGGKKYIVTSHYAGEKEIDRTIRSIAIDRAKREMGIAYGKSASGHCQIRCGVV